MAGEVGGIDRGRGTFQMWPVQPALGLCGRDALADIPPNAAARLWVITRGRESGGISRVETSEGRGSEAVTTAPVMSHRPITKN